MGKGGRTTAPPASGNNAAVANATIKQEEEEWVSPFSKENLQKVQGGFPTKSELRNVIPAHCFEKSLPLSLYYVVRDVCQGILVWFVVYHVIGLSTDPPQLLADNALLVTPLLYLAWLSAWTLYALAMTAAVGGLWVIAHECGHGAFSDYPMVNGAVGWTIHSIMLVPYFSWAFSHAKHHRRTNDLEDGETHTPPTATQVGLQDDRRHRVPQEQVVAKMKGKGIYNWLANILYEDASNHDNWGDSFFAFHMLWTRLLAGWQTYLFGISSTGRLGNDKQPLEPGVFPDHFRPTSRLFPQKMYWKVIASNLGLIMTLSAVAYSSWHYGFRAVWFWYWGPYFGIHLFLVTVTWLHHTDPTIPQFDPDSWTWMKGALAGTVDRPLYPWVDFLSHHISSTHVVHHLFHEIPHYHATEATKAIREYLEPKGMYNYDPTPVWKALWKLCRRCHYVDAVTEGIQYFKSLEDIPRTNDNAAKKPAVESKKVL